MRVNSRIEPFKPGAGAADTVPAGPAIRIPDKRRVQVSLAHRGDLARVTSQKRCKTTVDSIFFHSSVCLGVIEFIGTIQSRYRTLCL